MDAKLKADWVTALRSGEYRQFTHGVGDQDTKRLCCLGVAAVVANPEVRLVCTDDAMEVLRDYGLDGERTEDGYTGTARTLIDMNDEKGASFAEIADYIEANIPSDHSLSESSS